VVGLSATNIIEMQRTIKGMQYLALIVPLVDGRWRWSVTSFGVALKGATDTKEQAEQMVDRYFEVKGGGT